MIWISDAWKDYEVLDTSNGERLERWGKYILVRPDPQVIWNTPHTAKEWKKYDARYVRSNTGGGRWTDHDLPERWQIRYKDYLTFNVKPMNFKHTGVFPEQAANWDFIRDTVAQASVQRPVRVLNLFAYSGGATLAAAAGGAEVFHVDASKGMVAWAKETRRPAAWQTGRSIGSWTTVPNLSSGRSAGAGSTTASSWIRPAMAGAPAVKSGKWRPASSPSWRRLPRSFLMILCL